MPMSAAVAALERLHDYEELDRAMQGDYAGATLDDVDEAVRLANDTPYGLGASIWSNDLARVHRMIPRIKAGTVWVNCHSMLDASLPFGGFKQSGIGREMGRAALDMFTESKSLMMAV